MRYIIGLFWLLIVVLGVSFSALNAHSTMVNYYIGELKLPLALVMLLSLVVGALLGIVAMFWRLMKKRARIRQLQRVIKQMQQEVKNLRSIPIQDDNNKCF